MTNRTRTQVTLTVLAGLGLLLGTLTTGCIPPTISAAASGAAKLAAGNASDLSAAEIVALVEIANAAVPDLDLEVSTAQAAAIADFLSTNNINDQDDFTAFIDGVTSGQTDLEIDEAVVALFVQDFEPDITDELSNQGGGSLTSGLTKVINSDLGTLTADEVQILGESLSNLDIGGEQEAVDLSDEQAAAIVAFIDANNVSSVTDFENLDPDTVEIPEGAEALFDGL